MGDVTVQHNDVGVELTRAEFTSPSTHAVVVAGAAARDLIQAKADGKLESVNTPSVQKIKVGGAAGTPTNEIDLAAGRLEAAAGTVCCARGQVIGGLGEAGKGALEFLHALLDEQSGAAIADRTGHWPGALSGTLGYTASGLPSGLASALVLDGATNAVDFGRMDFSTWQELSVSLWVKIAADAADASHALIGNNTFNCTDGWSIFWVGTGGTDRRLFAYHNGVGLGTGAGNTFTKDAWHHIVFTIRRDAGLSLVVDGVVYPPVSGASSYSLNTAYSTKLGVRATSSGYWAKASVAGLRIYNRALSLDEALALYAGGAGRKEPFVPAVGGLLDAWQMVAPGLFSGTAVNTYQVTCSDPRVAPGVPLRIIVGSVAYYYMALAVSGSTVTVAGPALSTTAGAIRGIAIRPPSAVVVERFPQPGSYASGRSAGDVLESRVWRRGAAALVALTAKHGTNDTGAVQPYVNLKIGGNAVSTMNTNQGPSMSSAAWTPDLATGSTLLGAINAANYSVALNGVIDLVLTVTGSNKDAVGLLVDSIWVLK